MEMPIDQEDFDNEIFETLTSPKSHTVHCKLMWLIVHYQCAEAI